MLDQKLKTKNFVLELFFPSFCLGCKQEGSYLCQDCKETLEISQYNYCLCNKDALRLPPEQKSGKCSRCQDKKLSGVYTALPYQEKLLTRKLIYQFKYDPYIQELAKPLANIIITHFALAQNASTDIWQNSILVPVPLETSRLKSRGYNQSELLAQEISKILPVPTSSHNLIKIKKTLPQQTLSAAQRQENVKNAFAVKNPAEFAGKKVFLVDDVYTTGATMNECGNVLRTSGAKQVWGIAIAREGLK